MTDNEKYRTIRVHVDDGKIRLLPAWPKDWDVHFKLHAPHRTVVEGRVKDGKLVDLKVAPETRRKDVVVAGGGVGESGSPIQNQLHPPDGYAPWIS